MKYFEFELNGETIKFRLTTENAQQIEKKTGKGLFDLLYPITISNVVTLLTYLRRGELLQFSEKDTFALCDKLIDSGMTYEDIMDKIIYESLVVSGFLSQNQLEEAKKMKEEIKKNIANELQN